jgi:hypothetical protein
MSHSTKISHPAWAGFIILIGLIPVAIALGVLPVDESSVHAPMWVVALGGLVFVWAGCLMLVGQKSIWSHLFAGLILLSFAAVGAWVALFGAADGFSGGIPMLSHETNTKVARGVFGFGSFCCLLLFVYAVRQIFVKKTEGGRPSEGPR